MPTKDAGKRYRKGKQRAAYDGRGKAIRDRVTHSQRGLTTAFVCGIVQSDGGHAAAFDRRLVDAFVLCYCPPGGLVCDPFVGSGTTAMSAAKHGRRFVGGDLGARERDGRRWADIARERAMEILDPAQRSLF